MCFQTSFTLSSKIYMTPCHQLMFCDTPGANAMADKFKNNLNIATGISYRPLSRYDCRKTLNMYFIKASTFISIES